MKRTGRTLNDSNAAESQICGAKPCVPLYTEGKFTKGNSEMIMHFYNKTERGSAYTIHITVEHTKN